MNYYEHHLGDYLRDTAHLSMLEDGAYRRLLDAYYIREAPLPVELRDVFRLVRAQTKQDRAAVETVLREFFSETAEGWRHSRCDREVAEYHETIPDREARRENDRERQRRSRERRKTLFDALRSHGIVPPFDTKTSDLEALLSRVTAASTSQPVTTTVTDPVTRDNTATHPPSPISHPPEEKEKTKPLPPVEASGPAPNAGPEPKPPAQADAFGKPPPTPPPAFDGLNADALNGKAVVPLAAAWELPEQWGLDAEGLGWKPAEVMREAERFRQYWVAGRGQGTRRSVKGWRQTWSNWLDKAAKDRR